MPALANPTASASTRWIPGVVSIFLFSFPFRLSALDGVGVELLLGEPVARPDVELFGPGVHHRGVDQRRRVRTRPRPGPSPGPRPHDGRHEPIPYRLSGALSGTTQSDSGGPSLASVTTFLVSWFPAFHEDDHWWETTWTYAKPLAMVGINGLITFLIPALTISFFRDITSDLSTGRTVVMGVFFSIGWLIMLMIAANCLINIVFLVAIPGSGGPPPQFVWTSPCESNDGRIDLRSIDGVGAGRAGAALQHRASGTVGVRRRGRQSADLARSAVG